MKEPLKRVTLLRNEQDYKVFDAIVGNIFETSIADERALTGEKSRCYVHVEQADGNMAWSSPV
jgi:hypothetical protein